MHENKIKLSTEQPWWERNKKRKKQQENHKEHEHKNKNKYGIYARKKNQIKHRTAMVGTRQKNIKKQQKKHT